MRQTMAIWLLAAGMAWGQEDVRIQGKPLSQWMKQLRGDNRGIQLRAARAIAEAPTNDRPKIIEQVMPVLKSPRENDKFAAAQILGEYGPVARAAIPDLLPMLEGTEYERNRAAAAKALGQILADAPPSEEVEKVTKALIALFRDKYPDVQRESVEACGRIGRAAKACLPHLAPPLEHGLNGAADAPYLLVRRATAWTLGRMGPLAKDYIDRLVARMHGEGPSNPEAVEAIGCIGAVHDNVAPNLVDFLEKGKARDWRHYPTSKMAGWKALEKFGPKAAPAVPLIARFLREGRGTDEPPELVIQWFAVLRAIGAGAKEALPQVQKYVDEKSVPGGWGKWAKPISEAAAKTVEALGGTK